MAYPSSRYLAWAAGAGSLLSFAAAAYLYSAAVLIESGCHRGDAVACHDLSRALWQCAAFATLGVALALAGALAMRGRRALR